jgi:cell wall-associated NlpC family hydrolase
MLSAQSAGAATPRTAGSITYATQDTWHHVLSIQGLAWNQKNQKKSLEMSVFANGHFVGHVRANRASNTWAKEHHVRGKHAFKALLHVNRVAHKIVVLPAGQRTGGLARNARHVMPAPGTRVVDVAKKYVGHARYVFGGSSPHGFDCSGYTKYAYAHADVKALPHNSESQRHVRGMHEIRRKNARPGDLVFYFGGSGGAYHVALYTGHGMQLSAADPQEGIKRQKVWSHNVEFMSITH